MAERKSRTKRQQGEAGEESRPTPPAEWESLEPTPASQWRFPVEETFVVRLPSGNSIRLRRISALDVLTEGVIPDELSGVIHKIIETTVKVQKGQIVAGDKEGGPPAEVAAEMIEYLPQIQALADVICRRAAVEPAIAENDSKVGEGEIPLRALTLPDKLAIMNAIMGATKGFFPVPG